MTENDTYKCQAEGFQILEREQFKAYATLNGYQLDEAGPDCEELAKLKERVEEQDGDYVLYDPDDNSDGFLLVGNDPKLLDDLWAQHWEEITSD